MKKTTMWVATALLMAATATIGCSSSSDEPDNPNPAPLPVENNELQAIELDDAEMQMVNGSNDFAFNLFRAYQNYYRGDCERYTRSTVMSPISITYALGMLNNGAAGETQAQINRVLGFGETGADSINNFCRKMLTKASKLDKLTKVLIANTIYMNKNYELMPDFIKQAKTYYDADPETRDFADGKTRDVINKWANDHTEGMIPEVLNEMEFNPLAVSYLLNAIYFNGNWAEKFDKRNTKDEEFEFTNVKKKVPMMRQEHEFYYSENDLCQALRMPYGNGAYAMTILLPKEGKSINDLYPVLTAKTWEEYRLMDKAIVNVKLPRFESDSKIDLRPLMSRLGMPNAFDHDIAEFPNFCNNSTYIEMMKQMAKIKVSEEGTEAAAVTVIGMKNEAMPKHVNFHATRPFLYIISEQSTGAIFFIGQLTDSDITF